MPPSPTTNTFPGTTPLLAGWLSCATASCSLLAGVPVLHGDDGTFFEKRIRPILVEHCIECHGPDPASRRGGLRLDGPAAILAGGESGPVVVPGSPESSRLHRAVSYLDPEFQMPPRGRLDERDREAIRTWIASGAAMPAAAPARPEPAVGSEEPFDWARERRHWAYQPVLDPAPPPVLDEDWCRNGIDRFILARLEDAGLRPAPEADRRTLIRRAYFDLLGLPPTPEAVERFLDDDSPDAFDDLVDELLASPHYGERWARHWLDVARYADSNGLDENTAFGNAWRYRDWVVRALNDDKPYDQFVIEQIAGDLLPEDDDRRPDRMLATGFLSLGPKVLAEPDKEKMQVDIVDEQLDVLGQAFLAQTIGCARCHDHKFDPITARDYHAMAGILYSTRTMRSLDTVARVHERELATRDQVRRVLEHERAMEENRDQLDRAVADGGRELRTRWLADTAEVLLATRSLAWSPRIREAEAFDRSNLGVDHDRWGSGIGVIHTVRPDELQYVEYDHRAVAPGEHELRLRYASQASRPVRLLVDGELVTDALCASETGAFTPDGMTWTTIRFELGAGDHVIRLEREVDFPHLDRLSIAGPGERLDLEASIEEVAREHALDPGLLERWAFALAAEPIFLPWRALAVLDSRAFDDRRGRLLADLHAAYAPDSIPADGIEDRTGVGPDERVFLRSIVAGDPPLDPHEFALRWALAVRMVVDAWERREPGTEPDGFDDPGLEAMRRVLLGEAGILHVAPDHPAMLATAAGPRLERLLERRRRLEASEPAPFEMGIVVEDATPTDLPVFVRGEHTNPGGEAVPRGTLTVLAHLLEPAEIPAEASGRLELARWIVDPDNPLTSRVAVNRVWKAHFGRGIAANPSNFGTRGAAPSHPRLLDWLARRFVADGWSMKRMHRLILDSAAWRMGAQPDADLRALDPANRLFSRRDPIRLEAEPIRDALLAVGGSLDLTMGGSLLRSTNFGYVTNDQSTSNERYVSNRRAIYLPVIRNDMYPFFSIFDYPDSSVPVDARPRTVVAQQALFMMNSPLVIAQAEALAGDLLADPGLVDDEARVAEAYRRAFARGPDPLEVRAALDHLQRVRASPAGFRSVPWTEGDEARAPIRGELGALRSLCQVLFASNEFIYLR